MATEPEIHRIRNNRVAARSISQGLFLSYEQEMTDWEVKFVKDMASEEGTEPLSYRQAEKLLQIRDAYLAVLKYRGITPRSLVNRCWEGRIDLSEENADFIEVLHSKKSDKVLSRDLPRLLRCAHQLGWIERHMLIAAPGAGYEENAERSVPAVPPPAAPKWKSRGAGSRTSR